MKIQTMKLQDQPPRRQSFAAGVATRSSGPTSHVSSHPGSLGTLYRPKFVIGGVAVHGVPRVPDYPASRGCIRVTNAAMDVTVWIHE